MLPSSSFGALVVLGSLTVGGCSQNDVHCNCPAPVTAMLTIVDDATGLPVSAQPSDPYGPFSVDGRSVAYECSEPIDASGPCSAWYIDGVFGPATIHVAFAGYQPADVPSDVARGDDCCGLARNPLVTTVRLKKS